MKKFINEISKKVLDTFRKSIRDFLFLFISIFMKRYFHIFVYIETVETFRSWYIYFIKFEQEETYG